MEIDEFATKWKYRAIALNCNTVETPRWYLGIVLDIDIQLKSMIAFFADDYCLYLNDIKFQKGIKILQN